MECPRCNKYYDDSFPFCPYCAEKNPLTRPALSSVKPPLDAGSGEQAAPPKVGMTPQAGVQNQQLAPSEQAVPKRSSGLRRRGANSVSFLRDHWKVALAIGIAFVVVVGGLVGYLSWKSANDNKLVKVKTGSNLVCVSCGKQYNSNVKTVTVKNKDRGQYRVTTTKEGTCDQCRYGPWGAQFKAALEALSKSGFFKSDVTIPGAAAEFMKSHANCLPAASQGIAEAVTNPVDPRLVARDYTPYTGGLVHVYGSVIKTESIDFGGGKLTFLQISPKDTSDSWFVFYPADTDVLDQDYGDFWLLPLGTTTYDATMGTRSALVTVGSWVQKAQKPW